MDGTKIPSQEGPGKMGVRVGEFGGGGGVRVGGFGGVPPEKIWWPCTSFVIFYFGYYKLWCNAKAAKDGKKEAQLNNY